MATAHEIDPERLSYNMPEAAGIIGVSVRTLYDYMQRGTLKTIKLGGRRLVRRAELERLIDGAEPV